MSVKQGDDKEGFEVEVQSADRILKLRCWGGWNLARAEGYMAAMRGCYQELGSAKPWFVLADITRYPPQSPEVAGAHGTLMMEATQRGMAKAASLVDKAMTALQIQRLANESHMPELSFFKNEPEARAWLLKG